jgi:hypothetical protein
MTSTPTTETTPQVELTLLKEAPAPKLSKRAAGKTLLYRLWTNEQRNDVFWQIAANEGGQHSLELVATSKVRATLESQAGNEPFRTKQLRTSFRGRSQNNPGFLVCLLYAEGLVQAAEKAHHHALTDTDWHAWRDAYLALPGQTALIALPLAMTALPADTSEPVSRVRRGAKRRVEANAEQADASAT